jgi:YVTN family beta-propeller protein
MDFRILGPLEVLREGQPLALGGSKQRAVLAVLLLNANEAVSIDRLIDALWGESAPSGAVQSVRVHVSRLRKVLENGVADGGAPTVLVTTGGGYELRVEDGNLDLVRFERLFAEGRRALATEQPERAAKLLADALALWRGPALADLAFEPFAQTDAARLDELRVAALEDRIEADLAVGRHAAVVSELNPLIEQHPLRERLRRLQMLALYRCGRQAEALDAYRKARETLVEEIGVEPGPELRELHDAMLRQDSALDAPAAPRPASPAATVESPATATTGERAIPGLGRVPALAIVAALGLAGVLLVIGLVSGGDEANTAIAENSVGRLDPSSGEVRSEIPLGDGPGPSATDGTSVWIANTLDDTVSRVDAESGQVSTIDIGGEPAGVAIGADFAWVTDATEGTVEQVDPEATSVVGSLEVGNGPGGVVVAFGAVWVVTAVDGAVVQVDLARGEVTDRIPVGSRPTAIAAGAGSLWVTDEAAGTVIRVQPESGRVSEAIAIGNGPDSIAFGEGAVWVANRIDGTVSRIDPVTNSVTSTVEVGAEPSALAVDDQGVWVASSGDGRLSRLDPETGEAGEQIEVGGSPSGLALTPGGVWTSVQASRESHRGGTLRLSWEPHEFQCRRCVDPIDYDNTQSWELASLAYDGLIAYRRVGGAAASTLVGNLATDVPEPSADGRTYVFELRSGIRFSNGDSVRPEDFRSSIERLLRVNGGGSFASYFEGIVGGRECVAEPKGCDLSEGIETDGEDGTITVHLTAPDPDFLHKLTLPLASVLPQDAPPRLARRPIAGTGPYRIVDYDAERGGHLVRNPEFDVWSQDARPDGFPDEITIEISDDPEAQVAAVERGEADYVTVSGAFGGPLSPADVGELAVRQADRLHSAPLPETDYVFLNTNLPPFDDARVRRAINFAVDRRTVVELAGGNLLAQPTCQAVPPGFPGYRAYCPYTLNPNPAGSWVAPDIAAAERLVRESGTRGARIEIWTFPERKPIVRYFVSLLRQLGYRSSLRVLPVGRYYSTIYEGKARIQAGYNGWYADYLAPANFADLYKCSDADNFSQFCDRGVDGQLDRALTTQGSDPAASTALWQDVDRAITDAAPSVELLNRKSAVLVSERVENVQQHPLWGVLEDQLWVE